MNHKSTPIQLFSKSLSTSASLTKALALSLREQKITNRKLKLALLSTKKTLYSAQGNFFAETIMLGAKQFISFGVVVGRDEFLDTVTVESFAGLNATTLATKIAMTRLEVLEEIHFNEKEGVSYAT